MTSATITPEQSNAFVATFELPATGSGPLDGLCFAVKDMINIAGMKTGCGNPSWSDTHSPAVVHAICVEQLLCAGGRCVGKTVSDELGFSLLGQNHFFGTPLNPHAPERVPGGSSSGSASAVACGLVDFAVGTDTGGSVRVPASNCGIWGFRPSHGLISVAGVNPFAPTFDTVGVLAPSAELLARAVAVLLASPPAPVSAPTTIYLLRDAFAQADADVQKATDEPLQRLRDRFRSCVKEISLADLVGDSGGADFQTWADTYRVVQWAEIRSSLGSWIDATRPQFGPAIASSFALTIQLERGRIADAVARRQHYWQRLRDFLGPYDLLCMPTTPTLAPLKDEIQVRSASGSGYYPRTLAYTSLAGIGRLPQVSMPLAHSAGVPIGLSLLAANGQDTFLLELARSIANQS